MQDKQLVMIKPDLWEAISQRARSEQLTTETWLARQLARDTQGPTPCADDLDATMLDLTLKHFADLDLDADERRAIASAIMTATERGEPCQVGPTGRLGRYYRFQRRTDALRIQLGEGAVTLPIEYALRLATRLHGADSVHLVDDMAA
jgi:hypothetical protein